MLRGGMHLTILYHGHCFDGCASAALFGRFMAEREGARLTGVVHRPMAHAQGDPFPADAFAGPLNACVDFRWSANPGLHWWFDHHASAFLSPADQAAFESRRSPQHFWDPAAPSCTGFIARTLRSGSAGRRAGSRSWSTGPRSSTPPASPPPPWRSASRSRRCAS